MSLTGIYIKYIIQSLGLTKHLTKIMALMDHKS